MKPAARPLLALVFAIACPGVTSLAANDSASAPRASLPPDVQDLIFLGPMRPMLVRLRVTIDGQPFRQQWQKRFDELFAREDRQKRGHLTIDEADSLAREMNGATNGTSGAVTKDSLKQIANSAGFIERAALLAYLDKTLPPFALRRRAAVAQGSVLALFPLLDTDNNHQLSAAELERAQQQLEVRDFDDNLVITPGELILDPKAIAAAADPASADRELKADDGPVLLLDQAATADVIADRLLARYDRNHDGKLTSAVPEIEIALPTPLMGRLDVNHDAALDRDELTRFADRVADMELPFAFGAVSERRRRDPPAPEGMRVRRTLLGDYDLRLGEANINFVRNNRDPQKADLVSFRTFDRDNNSYLDPQEANGNNISNDSFAAMDVDGDKKVYKGEFTSYMDRQNEAAATRLLLEVTDFGQDLFEMLDGDKDGGLSPRELQSAKDLLNVEDKNADGVLNGDEIPQHLRFELVRGTERPEPERAMAPRQVARSTAKANASGPLWFRKMDRNNDGDVSQQEFVGPLATFRKLDANHDQLIDREEAEAAGK